jgi:hypothetical protein
MCSASMRGGTPGSADVSIDALLPDIGRLRSEGAVVLLKWDGERAANAATVVVTRQDYVFRNDGDDIEAMLRDAIADCRAHFPAGAT